MTQSEQPVEAYKCLDCSKEFKSPIGPTDCLYCGSRNVQWVSYNISPPLKKSPEQVEQEIAERIFGNVNMFDR